MRPFALLCLTMSLAACGSGGSGPADDPGPAGGDEAGTDVADLGADAADAVEDLPPAPQDVWDTRYRIVLLGDSPDIFLLQGETASMRVKIYDRDAGAAPTAVPNFPVGFEITAVRDLAGAEATGDATIEQGSVTTGTNGVATGRIVTGDACVRVYDVTVTAGDAEPLVYHVQVNCADCGCVRVRAAYDGTLPDSAFEGLEARAYPEGTSCIDLQMGTATAEPTATGTLAGLDGAAAFDCLPAAENSIAVVVSATGPTGCPVAWGCQELLLKAGNCRDANLDLYDLFLDASGTFDWSDRLGLPDLDQACPGGDTSGVTCFAATTDLGRAMCCVVGETARVLGTPRSTLGALAGAAAKNVLPDLCAGTDCDQHPVKLAFAAAGTAYDAQVVPPWTAQVPGALVGVIPALESLDLSWVTTSTVATSGSVSLSPAFGSVTLDDPACTPGGTCPRLTLQAAALASAPTPVQVSASTFDASITPAGRLSFAQRSIPLDLGRLFLHLAQDRGIARVSDGAVRTPADAANAWFDCAWMVPQVVSRLDPGLGVTNLQVQEVCRKGYDAFLEALTTHLATVTLSSSMVVHGEATLRDANCDRLAEAFEDGAQDGGVQSGAGQGAVVSGTFEAVARPPE